MSHKASCEIIKDMLPLYYDDVCSDDTKRMVEEHLVGCDSCKGELDKFKTEFKLQKEDIEANSYDRKVIKNISSFWKRSKFRSFIKGIIISAIMFGLIILGYFGLFHWYITPVSTDAVDIKNVSKLKDGKIIYFAEVNDGYSLNFIKYHMDNKGNFFITPLRAIIKQEVQLPYGPQEKGYDFIDVKNQEKVRGKKIKKIYYGTARDKILVWKKGMDLPKASEELENRYNFE